MFLTRSRKAVRLTALVAIFCTLLPGSAAWGVTVLPPPTLVPLNQVAVPQPPNLYMFVKDNAAAVRLGKALFWDMQAGSDGLTACATCHFRAGADSRTRNTVHPGPGNVWEAVAGPNETLSPAAFPFHQRSNPDLQSSPVTRDFHDIVGSQGVRLADFLGITPGSAVDATAPLADPLFTAGGVNVRQVTGRNTPSVINAVFNFNNFWDGRAHFIFNGENPFGPADPNAGVWYHNAAGAAMAKQKVAIEFASLASQAVGPALNDVEMSAKGRTFPELGRKMLSLTPLGKQQVHPGDSALGPLSRAVRQPDGTIAGANGLSVSYDQMIRAAFQDNLWSSPQSVTLPTKGVPLSFSQIEANFSLFWGLAVRAYLATLVSDQTPFDRFLGGDNLALTDQQKLGFAIFQGVGDCVACHGGTELTNASHGSIKFVTNADNAAIELMFTADGNQVIYDNGFNNTGVTPIGDDIGRGGDTPFDNPSPGLPAGTKIPLNFSRRAELQALGLLPFATPILDVFIPADFPVNANGSFKVPALRNVELTSPYFHNGGARTLEEVVEFYVRGGNFPVDNIAELDTVIMGGIPLLQGDPVRKGALVAFLKALTDPRVAAEAAPFDHPEIFIPEGEPEVLTRIAAKDAAGVAALPTNLTLDPVATPSSAAGQTITGTVQAGMTIPAVSVNGALPENATVTGTAWSHVVAGLAEGANTVTVSATDSATGVQTTLAATITLDTVAPAITMNPVASPVADYIQTVSGTVEAGAAVRVSVNGAAAAEASVTGSAWSHTVSLPTGTNSIDVVAIDGTGNWTALPTATVTLAAKIPPSAVNDAAETTVNTARVIDVLANDSGMSSPIAPNTLAVTASVNGGTVAANPDGTVTYMPAAGFAGTDFFAYTVRDSLGTISNPATVTVSITSPAPTVAETVAVLRAQFRAGTNEWVVEGTTTNATATAITIYTGNGTSGQIVGTATPEAGHWKFRQAGSLVIPDATRTISVQSSPGGASRLAFPVAVR